MAVLAAVDGRTQAADLLDYDDYSRCDAAAPDGVEAPSGTAPLIPDLPCHGVRSEPPLPAGRTAVQDVFRPPTR